MILPFYSDYLLGQVAYIPCPHRASPSRDDILKIAAQQKGMPVDTLESDEAVQKQRDKIPSTLLAHAMKYGLSIDPSPVYTEVVAAFNAGDFERVAYLSSQAGLTPDEQKLFRRIMVEERNAAWRTPLEAYLNEGNTVVVVGAAHLPGRGGLLEILRADGFQIKKIELQADDVVGSR